MSDDAHTHILAVRRGTGANCSSIGSAVEMLFLSATAGAALLAAVSAALAPAKEEPAEDTTKRGAAPPETPPTDGAPSP